MPYPEYRDVRYMENLWNVIKSRKYFPSCVLETSAMRVAKPGSPTLPLVEPLWR